jgi:hypothetical protein
MSEDRKETHTFMLDLKGSDGANYRGKFTTHRLNLGEISQVGIRKIQLNGGYFTVYDNEGNATGKGMDPATDSLNEMWSQCEVALIQQPDWFTRDDLKDPSILGKVFKEVRDFEDTFRKPQGVVGDRKEESEGESVGESPPADIPSEMVGSEVPTISKKRRVPVDDSHGATG